MFSKSWLAAFVVPVLLQGMFAYWDDFLTPAQVIQHRGQGLPFLAHGGMWSDILLFAPLMAYILGTYGGIWSSVEIVSALILGLAASVLMHYLVYVPGAIVLPEAHAHDGAPTMAGYIHIVYMAIGLAVIALFYFVTPIVAFAEAATVSAVLFVHVVIGTHAPFKIFVRIAEPTWYPVGPIIDNPGLITLGIVGAVLVILSDLAAR